MSRLTDVDVLKQIERRRLRSAASDDPLGINALIARVKQEANVIGYWDARQGITLVGTDKADIWAPAYSDFEGVPNLVAVAGSRRPVWDGDSLHFDGVDDVMQTENSDLLDILTTGGSLMVLGTPLKNGMFVEVRRDVDGDGNLRLWTTGGSSTVQIMVAASEGSGSKNVDTDVKVGLPTKAISGSWDGAGTMRISVPGYPTAEGTSVAVPTAGQYRLRTGCAVGFGSFCEHIIHAILLIDQPFSDSLSAYWAQFGKDQFGTTILTP